MLSLRVVRGSSPTVLVRRLLVVVASAGTGFLLLAALGDAMGHPEHASSATVRLAWCVVPLMAAVYLSVVVTRTEPSGRLHAGLAAAGLGRGRLPLLAAATSALSCLLGSAAALLVFLQLRGGLIGSPSGGDAGMFGAGRPLPVAGALTLLVAVPVAAAAASAFELRPRRGITAPADGLEDPGALSAVVAPPGLPWGITLSAIGLAVATAAADSAAPGAAGLLTLPGGLGTVPPAVMVGWALTGTGMVLAVPGLMHAGGRLLALHRPSALRLLAGRTLQEESRRTGRPLGVLCATCAAALSASELYGDGTGHPFGPLSALGAALTALCVLGSAATATVEAKRAREHSTATLTRIGAPVRLLRTAAVVRAGALVVVLAPFIVLLAELAVAPVRP